MNSLGWTLIQYSWLYLLVFKELFLVMYNYTGYVYVRTDTNAQKGQKHWIRWSWWLLRVI